MKSDPASRALAGRTTGPHYFHRHRYTTCSCHGRITPHQLATSGELELATDSGLTRPRCHDSEAADILRKLGLSDEELIKLKIAGAVT
jgi:hypothetical protein